MDGTHGDLTDTTDAGNLRGHGPTQPRGVLQLRLDPLRRRARHLGRHHGDAEIHVAGQDVRQRHPDEVFANAASLFGDCLPNRCLHSGEQHRPLREPGVVQAPQCQSERYGKGLGLALVEVA
jgi:hypothetical protein